jgi:Na+/proline symporter
MPKNIVRFERLMYLTLGMGVIIAALQDSDVTDIVGMGMGFALSIQVLVFAFLALLIWLTARRQQNWARWILAVSFFLGLPFDMIALPDTFRSDSLAAALSVCQAVIQAIALYLAFSGRSRDWFRRHALS